MKIIQDIADCLFNLELQSSKLWLKKGSRIFFLFQTHLGIWREILIEKDRDELLERTKNFCEFLKKESVHVYGSHKKKDDYFKYVEQYLISLKKWNIE
jgi:hypothetical protein